METRNEEPNNTAMPSSADRIWSEFMAAIDALTPDVRAAFLLHEIFEASYDDIARLIGEPADICRSHVEHAREHALARMQPLDKHAKVPPQ